MINLIPDFQKQELIKIEKEKIQIIFLFLLNFFFICLLLLFLFLNIYFNSQIQSTNVLITSLDHFKEPEEIKEQIIKTNEELFRINKFYQNRIYYSSVLDSIFLAMPDGVYLNNISFIDKKINLSGFVPFREDLLLFRENLEKSFKQVDFPPVNWSERENINFFVTFSYEKQ
ncbi:MAG: PilN domain-containing protein [Candidatus Pacebacteria bacterium]|nr:PilN domain-containing protein [Candidatus Paceibacterota bacterium]